jgi:hypothetical protein
LRRHRNAVVLAVSLGAHIALMAAWLSTRPSVRFVEPPTMVVQLVRPPPREPERSPPPSPPKVRSPTRLLTPEQAPVPPLIVPPAPRPSEPEISPEWRVKAGPPGKRPGLPFNTQPAIRPPPCKTSNDHSDRPGDPCPSWSAEEQASHYNVVNDPKMAGFAYEGARKQALKDYREKAGKPGPGPADASDYPGLRCTIFHTHC